MMHLVYLNVLAGANAEYQEHMWDEHHHYGALRRELCQFCIDYLEKEDAKPDDSGSATVY